MGPILEKIIHEDYTGMDPERTKSNDDERNEFQNTFIIITQTHFYLYIVYLK